MTVRPAKKPNLKHRYQYSDTGTLVLDSGACTGILELFLVIVLCFWYFGTGISTLVLFQVLFLVLVLVL